mmetsp:Transcript_12946/g.39847  ORF Transcript_12946/g.39847 Transcript_12946/m.39847 type:complete len:404 (+) Transcript_12946:89-1300(+)
MEGASGSSSRETEDGWDGLELEVENWLNYSTDPMTPTTSDFSHAVVMGLLPSVPGPIIVGTGYLSSKQLLVPVVVTKRLCLGTALRDPEQALVTNRSESAIIDGRFAVGIRKGSLTLVHSYQLQNGLFARGVVVIRADSSTYAELNIFSSMQSSDALATIQSSMSVPCLLCTMRNSFCECADQMRLTVTNPGAVPKASDIWTAYKMLAGGLRDFPWTSSQLTTERFVYSAGTKLLQEKLTCSCRILAAANGTIVDNFRGNAVRCMLESRAPSRGLSSTEDRPPAVCTSCERSFRRIYDLQRHLSSVHNRKVLHFCKMCDKHFSRKDQLEQHMKLVHFKQRLGLCEICFVEFSTKSAAERHRRIVHERIRRYECKHCNFKFYQRSDLNRHDVIKHGSVSSSDDK